MKSCVGDHQLTFKLKMFLSRPDQQAFLITAAGGGDHLISALIGCGAQLRTADGEFVNDLDSSESGGRGFTQTMAVFNAPLTSNPRK